MRRPSPAWAWRGAEPEGFVDAVVGGGGLVQLPALLLGEVVEVAPGALAERRVPDLNDRPYGH